MTVVDIKCLCPTPGFVSPTVEHIADCEWIERSACWQDRWHGRRDARSIHEKDDKHSREHEERPTRDQPHEGARDQIAGEGNPGDD